MRKEKYRTLRELYNATEEKVVELTKACDCADSFSVSSSFFFGFYHLWVIFELNGYKPDVLVSNLCIYNNLEPHKFLFILFEMQSWDTLC